MNNKALWVILSISILVAVGVAASAENVPVQAPVRPADTASSTAPVAEYALDEVAQHAAAESCWTVVADTVYDLTTWISMHPGGQKTILKMCGKDSTESYAGKHGENARANSELATFKIGLLKK